MTNGSQSDHDMLVRIHEAVNGQGGIQETLKQMRAEMSETRKVAYAAKGQAEDAETLAKSAADKAGKSLAQGPVACTLAQENRRRLDKTQSAGGVIGVIVAAISALAGMFVNPRG